MGKPVARIVHVKHLFLYFVKKWYVLLLGILIGVFCFSFMGIVNIKQDQKTVANKPQEKKSKVSVSEAQFYNVLAIVEYEDMLAEKNKYMENSIRMQIDPFHRWDCSDTFTIVAGEEQAPAIAVNDAMTVCVELLSSQAFLEEVCNRMENKLDVGFLREIVTVTVISADTLSVSACHYDQAELRKLCDLMSEIFCEQAGTSDQLRGYEIHTKKGSPNETVDNGLLEVQNGIRSEAITTQDVVAYRLSLLTENEQEYLKLYREARNDADYVPGQELIKITTVEKEMPILSLSALKADMIKGVVAGMVLAVFVLSCIYIFHPCVLNPYNLTDMLGLRVLNDRKGIPATAQDFAITAFKVEQNLSGGGENKRLLITGSVITDEQEEKLKQLKERLEELGIKVLIAKSLKNYPDEVDKLKQVDQVILVERLEESRWDHLTWQVCLCQQVNKAINGVLLI